MLQMGAGIYLGQVEINKNSLRKPRFELLLEKRIWNEKPKQSLKISPAMTTPKSDFGATQTTEKQRQQMSAMFEEMRELPKLPPQ